MNNTGKNLEELVAFVERSVAHLGCTVQLNDKVINDDGVVIAEFDIIISGNLGTGQMVWLIECRDRPSAGAAPVSWIEQLVGRRQRFGFNKVTAVSTTGFSPAALEYGKAAGIDLREVLKLEPSQFHTVLQIPNMSYMLRGVDLVSATIGLRKIDGVNVVGVDAAIKTCGAYDLILESNQTGEKHSLLNAAMGAVNGLPEVWAEVEQAGGNFQIEIESTFEVDDFYFFSKDGLKAEIEKIDYLLNLSIKNAPAPLKGIVRYRGVGSDSVILDSLQYEPAQLPGHLLTVEIRHLPGEGHSYFSIQAEKNN